MASCSCPPPGWTHSLTPPSFPRQPMLTPMLISVCRCLISHFQDFLDLQDLCFVQCFCHFITMKMIRSPCIMWFPTDSVLWSPCKTWRPTWWRREARSQWVAALAILITFGASFQKAFEYSFFKSGVWCDKYHKRAKRFNFVIWEGECVQGNNVKLGTVIFFFWWFGN